MTFFFPFRKLRCSLPTLHVADQENASFESHFEFGCNFKKTFGRQLAAYPRLDSVPDFPPRRALKNNNARGLSSEKGWILLDLSLYMNNLHRGGSLTASSLLIKVFSTFWSAALINFDWYTVKCCLSSHQSVLPRIFIRMGSKPLFISAVRVIMNLKHLIKNTISNQQQVMWNSIILKGWIQFEIKLEVVLNIDPNGMCIIFIERIQN